MSTVEGARGGAREAPVLEQEVIAALAAIGLGATAKDVTTAMLKLASLFGDQKSMRYFRGVVNDVVRGDLPARVPIAAVEWARRAGIAIHARKTSDPVGGGRETVCVESATPKNVRAVVGLDRVVHARVGAGELRAFAELAAELDLGLLDVAVTGEAATCAIPLLNVPDWDRCRARIAERLGEAASLTAECGVVSVVGNGLSSGLARFVGVLEACGAGATPMNLVWT